MILYSVFHNPKSVDTALRSKYFLQTINLADSHTFHALGTILNMMHVCRVYPFRP
jgi:hypothetical protein